MKRSELREIIKEEIKKITEISSYNNNLEKDATYEVIKPFVIFLHIGSTPEIDSMSGLPWMGSDIKFISNYIKSKANSGDIIENTKNGIFLYRKNSSKGEEIRIKNNKGFQKFNLKNLNRIK